MEHQSENRICQNCKKDFIIEPDDCGFYEQMKVPPPTFCHICRAQRRFSFRNERVLYKRKSDFTGEEIFTMFSPESEIKIYERDIWLSDKWDPLDSTRAFLRIHLPAKILPRIIRFISNKEEIPFMAQVSRNIHTKRITNWRIMALAWGAEVTGGKEPIIGSRSRLFLPNK